MTTLAVRERGILMSAPMVRAIDEDRKSQTRRICKPTAYQRRYVRESIDQEIAETTDAQWNEMAANAARACMSQGLRVKYNVGDLLWVRENYRVHHGRDARIEYCAGGVWEPKTKEELERLEVFGGAANTPAAVKQAEAELRGEKPRPYKRSSIHMPKWACRIWLEITGVKVERVASISEADADAEGVDATCTELEWLGNRSHPRTFRCGFQMIWEKIHGPGAWDRNEWVWAVSFKRIEKPDGGGR